MSEANNPSLSAKTQPNALQQRGIFHLWMSQACLSETEQMKNLGGEATETKGSNLTICYDLQRKF
jgi:hypothetical protein